MKTKLHGESIGERHHLLRDLGNWTRKEKFYAVMHPFCISHRQVDIHGAEPAKWRSEPPADRDSQKSAGQADRLTEQLSRVPPFVCILHT